MCRGPLFDHRQTPASHYWSRRNRVHLDAILEPWSANAFAKTTIAALITPTAATEAVGVTAVLPAMRTTAPFETLRASHARKVSRRAMKLEFHARIPLLVSHLEQVDPWHRAGDIQKRVYPTKLGHRPAHDRFRDAGRHEALIDGKWHRTASLHLLRDLLKFVRPSRRQYNSREVAGKSDCRRSADS
jgi:hypothetical protein